MVATPRPAWRKMGRAGGSSVGTWLGKRDTWKATGTPEMENPMASITLYLAALLRGLAAHGLSLPLEAALVFLLPWLPAHACALIAILVAVVVVEAAGFAVERALSVREAAHEGEEDGE